jgi:hypothetical protein
MEQGCIRWRGFIYKTGAWAEKMESILAFSGRGLRMEIV